MEVIMKKTLYILALCAAALSGCQKPQFVESDANRQGLTSLTAIISSGTYANQEISKLMIDEQMYEDGNFVIEIPYYFPETSTEESTFYMTALRVQAELQPNFKISPALGLLDLTDVHEFTLTDPSGASRTITITSKRVKSKACKLLSFMVDDYMVSGIIKEEEGEILIPYLGDLSNVSVSGQVSPHAKISQVSGKAYKEGGKYNLNTGATVSVIAADGKTSKTYTVKQGIPELLDMGLNMKSITQLFNKDAEVMCGLPAYTTLSYVSVAGLNGEMIVSLGNGTAPVRLDPFTGSQKGQINLGSAVSDAITNDDKGNMLITNFATGGSEAQTLNIYKTSDVSQAPSLFYSFVNPIDVPLGHRIKAIGDVNSEAVIVLTAEGIIGVTTTAKAVALYVKGGNVDKVDVLDFSSVVAGWGSAPINFATVVPSSLTPGQDGWFLDFYENNFDADGNDMLHYVDGKFKDNVVASIGDWACNPNCLDVKTFNNARYMTLFVVSHFPHWGIGPRLYLFDVTDPTSASLVVSNESLGWTQTGSYDPDTGAAGDVALVPTTDGYRTYIFYYDHHSQTVGAYVADCFKI